MTKVNQAEEFLSTAFKSPSFQATLHGCVLGYFATADEAQDAIDAALAEEEEID